MKKGGWREMIERHFGKEAVIWCFEDGSMPSDAEIRRRAAALLRNEAIQRYTALVIDRAEVLRMKAIKDRGETTGLSPAEEALLPDLIESLTQQIEAERERALAVYR